jgi:hypothetical protein
LGEEIEFIIQSFNNRRKGPIIRARSTGSRRISKKKAQNKSILFEDDWGTDEINETATANPHNEAFVELDTADASVNLDGDSYAYPKKQKKKKDKSRPLEDEGVAETTGCLIDGDTFAYPKKQKKKKDKSRPLEDEGVAETTGYLNTTEGEYQHSDGLSSAKKKKKKKMDKEHASADGDNLLDTTEYEDSAGVYSTKKSKKRIKREMELEQEQLIEDNVALETVTSPKKRSKKHM